MKTLYSSKYNIEFYHITKNAMTSVIKSLGLTWIDISKLPRDRKTFCILRDPVSRCISSYLMIKNLYKKREFKFSSRILSGDKIHEIFNNSDNVVGFEKYLTEIEENGFFDSHNIPQTYYLTNRHKELFPSTNWISDRSIERIDVFLDIKKLNNEIKQLLNDIHFRLKNINNSPSNLSKTIKNSLTPSTIERINTIYKEDFELYIEKIR